MKRLLVTGSKGFIGSHLERELGGEYEWIPYEGDMLTEDWDTCIREIRPEYLVNLAWITGAGYSDSEKNLIFLQKSIELYRAFYAQRGKRAVFIGTEQEYARRDEPLDEESEPAPRSLYAKCKASLGQTLLENSRVQGRSFAWCRVFFVYGNGEKSARLMPALINGLMRGETVTCSYEHFVRDYVHVSDLARALKLCLEQDGVHAVNIAGGRRTTIGEIAGEVMAQTGGSGRVRFRSREECGDQPMCIAADISQLRSFGWEPKVTLTEGIAMEIEYLRRQRETAN